MGGTKGYRSYRGRGSKGKAALAAVLVLVIVAALAGETHRAGGLFRGRDTPDPVRLAGDLDGGHCDVRSCL